MIGDLIIGQQGIISSLSTKVSVWHFMSFSLLSDLMTMVHFFIQFFLGLNEKGPLQSLLCFLLPILKSCKKDTRETGADHLSLVYPKEAILNRFWRCYIFGLMANVNLFFIGSFYGLMTKVSFCHSFYLCVNLQGSGHRRHDVYYQTSGDTSLPNWTDSHDFPENKGFTKNPLRGGNLSLPRECFFHKSWKDICSNVTVEVTKMLT